MADRRYWRLNISSTNGAAYLQIGEVELMANGGLDLTGSGTASASTMGGGHEADKAFDNNATTSWYSTVNSGWLKYDFGDPGVYVTKYTIKFSISADITFAPKDWQLQYSDDNTNWVTVHTVTNQTGWVTSQIRTFIFLPDWINKKNANDFSLRSPLKVNGNAAIRRAGI